MASPESVAEEAERASQQSTLVSAWRPATVMATAAVAMVAVLNLSYSVLGCKFAWLAQTLAFVIPLWPPRARARGARSTLAQAVCASRREYLRPARVRRE